MLELAKRAADDRITVRDIETFAQRQNQPEAAQQEVSLQKTEEQRFFEETEISLCERLGRRVSVKKGGKKGILTLEFFDREDLQSLCRLLAPDD